MSEPGMFGKAKSALWDLKVRLQFTGWLQFLPTGVVAALVLLLALIGGLVGVLPALLFWPPLALGLALLGAFLFDLITLKLGLRPEEALPPRRDALDAFSLMRARRSCRSFQARELLPEHRAEILEQARLLARPEALLGAGPIRFEHVAAPLTVWPVLHAREFLVAIAPKAYDRLAVIDVGRSLQKVVLHATRMGVATCWIGPGADHQSILRELGPRLDPERDHIICVCALGYASALLPLFLRAIIAGQRTRKPLRELFFASPALEAPLDTEAEPYRRFGRCYEVCQWSPSSFNEQPTRCCAVEEGGALVRFDFLASTRSRFYAPVALGIWCANWETGCEALGIGGRFEVLTEEERAAPSAPELPRYDLSWVLT